MSKTSTPAPALILETPRLLLRPFRDSDLAPFVAYRSDPTVAKYQSWDAPYTPAQAKEFIEELQQVRPATPGEWYQIAIEAESNRRNDR